jgi:hypothetical protein
MATKNDPVKPKVQTTKAVTVSNKPKKKGPVAKMGELETRTRATMIKAAESLFGFSKDMRTPHMQRILNKDASIYNKKAKAEKVQDAKDKLRSEKYKAKVEKLQEKGYSKSGFKTGGMVNSNAKVAKPKAKMGMSMKRKSC